MEVEVDDDRNTLRASTQLRRSGNSTVVTIPPIILGLAALQRGDEVELVAERGRETVTIRPKTPDTGTAGGDAGNGAFNGTEDAQE